MSEYTVIINSHVFEALLLPGRPPPRLRIAGLLEVQKSIHKNRGLNSEEFRKLCTEHGGLPPAFTQAVFLLAALHFHSYLKDTKIPSDLLLFSLFLQLYELDSHRLLRSHSADRISLERWPTGNKTGKRQISLRSKQHDEEKHLQFFRRRLSDFWQIFHSRHQHEKPCIWDVAFSFVKNNHVVSYDQIKQEAPRTDLIRTLLQGLQTSRDGVLACIKTGKRISWQLGDISSSSAAEKCKMATNAHAAPAHRKLIVLNQLMDKTLARRSSTLTGAHVRIHRCNNSFLYLLAPLASLSVTKCVNTTIVTGAVRYLVRLRDCKSIKVSTLAPLVVVGDTWESSLYVRTKDRVIVDGESCGDLGIYPYNANFNGLDEDEKALNSRLVYQQHPLVINQELSWNQVIRRQSYLNFAPFFIPFLNLNLTDNKDLPDEYKALVKLREEPMLTWKSFLASQTLSDAERRAVDTMVNTEFKAWLTKNNRELKGLESLLANTNLK